MPALQNLTPGTRQPRCNMLHAYGISLQQILTDGRIATYCCRQLCCNILKLTWCCNKFWLFLQTAALLYDAVNKTLQQMLSDSSVATFCFRHQRRCNGLHPTSCCKKRWLALLSDRRRNTPKLFGSPLHLQCMPCMPCIHCMPWGQLDAKTQTTRLLSSYLDIWDIRDISHISHMTNRSHITF